MKGRFSTIRNRMKALVVAILIYVKQSLFTILVRGTGHFPAILSQPAPQLLIAWNSAIFMQVTA